MGGKRFKNKVVLLATFFKFMMGIIDAAEAKRKAQIEKAKAQMVKTKQGGGSTIKSNPLPGTESSTRRRRRVSTVPGAIARGRW